MAYDVKVEKAIEKKLNITFIRFEDLQNSAPEFAEWFGNYFKKDNIDSMFQFMRDRTHKTKIYTVIWTEATKYTITILYPTPKFKDPVISLKYTKRLKKVGEHWHRSGELMTGKYHKQNFPKIASAMLLFEIKPIELFR